MAARTLQLQPGTERTEYIALPLTGSWLGLVRVKISTHTTAATIHEWLLIWPNAPLGRTYYRRTALSTANNWYNSTLPPDTDHSRWLRQSESVMKIVYTSTYPISVAYETTRTILPSPPPDQEPPGQQWNITSSTPWKGTGNNLAANNPTEKGVGHPPPQQLNGVMYWKPTT